MVVVVLWWCSGGEDGGEVRTRYGEDGEREVNEVGRDDIGAGQPGI